MKCNIVSGLAVSALLIAALLSIASAADMPVKAPPAPPETPAWNWAGFYAGLNAGGGEEAGAGANDPHNIVISTTPPLGGYPAITPGTNASGALGGVTFGYNWQRSNVVFGLETDIDASSIRRTLQGQVINGFGDQLTDEKDLNYVSTIRGRLGFAFNNVLFYGTGGFAFGHVNNKVVDILFVPPTGTVTMQRDTTETGYVVGGGIEYLIAPRWSLKAEYQYVDLGSHTLSSPEVPPTGFIFSTNNIVDHFHTVRVGVNYHL
jgi:outer membrane immunogenic protein